MVKGIAGVGTLFQRWDGNAWGTISDINAIIGPSARRDNIETTSFETQEGYREYIAGFKDGDIVSLNMNFTRETFEIMVNDFLDDESQYYQILFLDEDDTVIAFEGLVNKLPIELQSGDKIKANISIKVTGQLEESANPIEESSEVGDTPPYESDLIFWAKGRSGGELQDILSSSGENNPIILPAVYMNTNSGYYYGDNTRAEERVFDGNDYTIFCEISQLVTVPSDTTVPVLILGTNTTSKSRGIYIYVTYDDLRIRIGDDVLSSQIQMNPMEVVNSNFLPYGRLYMLLTINFSTKRFGFGLYDDNDNSYGSVINQDISTLTFNTDNNYFDYTFNSAYFGVSNFKKFNAIKTLANCKDDTYVTDLQLHYPSIIGYVDLVGGKNLVGQSTHNTYNAGYSNHNCWMLNYGYDRYVESASGFAYTYKHQLIPRKTNGDSVSFSKSNFRFFKSENGITDGYNLADAKIRFINDFFDRSDTDIWNDTCRASSYYNVNYPKDFHISELDQRVLYGYLKEGYKGRLYIHINDYSIPLDNAIGNDDRKYLVEILLYGTDHMEEENEAILEYTGDIVAAVLDSADNPEYDSEGYVQLGVWQVPKPMVIFRFDDEFAAAVNWVPFFNSYGLVATMLITTDNVGLPGYMTWAQLKNMEDAGWEMGLHTVNYDTNYWTDLSVTELRDMMATGKALIEANGLTCNFCSPHGNNNDAGLARYVAREYFNSFNGYFVIIGEVGLAPRVLDPYDLRQQIFDLPVAEYPYNIEDSEGMARMLALIDICAEEGRLMEITAHNYNAGKAAALAEVIEYCILKGIDIVTKTQAINACKFL